MKDLTQVVLFEMGGSILDFSDFLIFYDCWLYL